MSVLEWALLALKYGLVGLSGLLVDFGITWLLKERLKANPYLASGTGFAVAALSNYFLNRWFTYQSTSNQVLKELFFFVLIAVVGLLLNLLLL